MKFNVQPEKVPIAQHKIFRELNPKKAWGQFGGVEACSKIVDEDNWPCVSLFDKANLFAEAVHIAFYKHYPLVISPDVVWITIAQGVAQHVAQNQEKLRNKFVNFEGTQTLVVARPEFVKGSNDNDWEGVFPDFASQIEEFLKDETKGLFQSEFSTTTPTDKMVSQIVLMDIVKKYFKYDMMCGCGIPWIELTGTVQDWELIKQKVQRLKDLEMDLDFWVDQLLPVLDHFIEASKGNHDVDFWKSVCNFHGLSGSMEEPITGWIQVFFPYDRNGRKNWMEHWKLAYDAMKEFGFEKLTGERGRWGDEMENGEGLKLDEIPSGLSKAPVNYVDVPSRKTYPMEFYGGLVSLHQDPDSKALKVKTGWAVVEKVEKTSHDKTKSKKKAVYSDDEEISLFD
jgi:hypothetical protein